MVCTDEEGGYHRANPSNTAAGLDLEDFSNERYGDGDRDGGYNYNYGQGDWHAVQFNPDAASISKYARAAGAARRGLNTDERSI